MNCPVCGQKLIQNESIYMCPFKHGSLLTGKLLSEIKTLDLPDPLDSSPRADTQLICPHCSKPMQEVDYNSSGIIIDTCTNCPYRWLDAGEINKIRDYKPKLNPKDLPVLKDLQEKTDKAANWQPPDVNGQVFSDTQMGILRGGSAIGNDASGDLIIYATIVGLIRSMRSSKFMRVVGILFIIGFIVLGYLIYKASHQFDWSWFQRPK